MNALLSKGNLKGDIKILGSKSFAHRLLLGAFLSAENCKISNIPNSKDIEATLSCIKAMGGSFEVKNDEVTFLKSENIDSEKELTLDCYESGSTLRFLIPNASSIFKKVTYVGSEKLISRGIKEYVKIFNNQGIKYQILKDRIVVEGKLHNDCFTIKGDISSQYITGLLLALPKMEGDSIIKIIPPINSKNYIDITLSILDLFDVKYEINGNDIYIKGNQKFIAKDYEVEGDYSNAAFLEAFNYLGSDVNVLGLNPNSLQGDKAYRYCFEKLSKEEAIIDVANCIDLCPVLFVFAALNHGGKFINTERLIYKESDRIKAIQDELVKLGGEVIKLDNEVIVKPLNVNIKEVEFNTHNDHRILMALSLLMSKLDVKLNDIECVSKSYPDYFLDLTKLGACIKYER